MDELLHVGGAVGHPVQVGLLPGRARRRCRAAGTRGSRQRHHRALEVVGGAVDERLQLGVGPLQLSVGPARVASARLRSVMSRSTPRRPGPRARSRTRWTARSGTRCRRGAARPLDDLAGQLGGAGAPDPGDAVGVELAEPGGDDHRQRPANDLLGRPAEHPLGPAVPGQQPPRAVGGDDRVHRRLGDRLEPLLGGGQGLVGPAPLDQGAEPLGDPAIRSRWTGSPARSWVTNSSSTATTPSARVTGTAMASRTRPAGG